MWLLDEIAEQQIRQAIGRGELDNLPGAGKPIELDDDRMVPEELRAGYRLLKNAGYLPPELESMREARDLRALLSHSLEPRKRDQCARRLRLLELRLAEGRGRGLSAAVLQQYGERLRASLNDNKPAANPQPGSNTTHSTPPIAGAVLDKRANGH